MSVMQLVLHLVFGVADQQIGQTFGQDGALERINGGYP